METQELIETLSATPVWLREYFARITEADASRSPGNGRWSAADVLAHLRASDAILAPRVLQILVRNQAPLTGFDERAWASLTARARTSIPTQLATFEAQRSELVALLQTLTPTEWSAVGLHETRGNLTVSEIVKDLAIHEQEHRAQVEAATRAMLAQAPAFAPNATGNAPGTVARRRSHRSTVQHASA